MRSPDCWQLLLRRLSLAPSRLVSTPLLPTAADGILHAGRSDRAAAWREASSASAASRLGVLRWALGASPPEVGCALRGDLAAAAPLPSP